LLIAGSNGGNLQNAMVATLWEVNLLTGGLTPGWFKPQQLD
jgi:hypothetical protein